MPEKTWSQELLDYFVETCLPVEIAGDKVTIQGKLIKYKIDSLGSFTLLLKVPDGRVLVIRGWSSIKRLS